MVNYANGQIYKLVNNVDDEIYIGSTCGTLRLRKSSHKSLARKDTERRVYKHLNEIGWDNVDIILIEACDCQNKDELHRRERYWIDTLNPSLNKVLPRRTKKEYYEANKEVIFEKRDMYREANKQKIKDQQKEYNDSHKEEARAYREANKEIIKAKKKEKMLCGCGSTIRRDAKARHERSTKHQTYLASLE